MVNDVALGRIKPIILVISSDSVTAAALPQGRVGTLPSLPEIA